MNIFDAAILGVVEGITEFLPISSTAHLILASRLLGLEQTDFLKSFEIIIQLGAILAVITLYYKKFFDWQVLRKVIVGFLPTALLGLVFYKSIKTYLGNVSVVLWAMLIGGIILIIFEISKKSAARGDMSLMDCVKVGFFQAIAFIPGVSRSAATIVGGMTIGVSRTTIVEYSFLLAVPTMLAATGLDVLKNSNLILHSGNFLLLLVGLVVSYLVAMIAIKQFLSYIKKSDLVPFGVYRIAVAIIFFTLV